MYHFLCSIKESNECESANVKTAEDFVEELNELIGEKEYLSQQIFNMDET